MKLAVIGAGVMGHGIAQVASQVAGWNVSMNDIDQELLDRGVGWIRVSLCRFLRKGVIDERDVSEVIKRIEPTVSLEEAVENADLIIEAATEEEPIKAKILSQVSHYARGDAYLASNTSTLSITLLGSYTKIPERFCGMHFFNPPQLMNLVEVTPGLRTSGETVDFIVRASAAMGKQAVVLKKDSPGFIVNRILVPALNEAISLLDEGVADAQLIDKAVRLGLSWPIGPIALCDLIGLDTVLGMSEGIAGQFEDQKFRPPHLLKRMVRAGRLGRKNGLGFYEYPK